MAEPSGRPAPDLSAVPAPPEPDSVAVAGAAEAALAALEREPHRYGLFAALRLLEAAHPQAPRLGEARRARDEPVRLGQAPHLHFPPAQIAGVERRHGRLHLSTYAFGLFGPQGPLPLHVTREAFARARQAGDPALARFCDLFHHRLIALFYRAFATARPAIDGDRPAESRWRRRLGAIAGLPGPAFLRRSALPDEFQLFAAGLLAAQSRPPEAVARLVALLFAVPVRVDEFVGAWLEIPRRARTRLGLPEGASQLGVDAVAGARTFMRHQRFRVVLGPLDVRAFESFLPIGASLPKLRALVRRAAGLELDWDARLVLARDEVPKATLKGEIRLGWTSWLWADARQRDADDLVVQGSGGG